MENKTHTSKLKQGDLLSRISFMKVNSNAGGMLMVENEDGFSWAIAEKIVAQECYSTQYGLTQKVSRTELAEILMSARDAIVSVNFNKQATTDSIKQRLGKLVTASDSKVNKELKELLKGEVRDLVGFVVGAESVLGRTIMIDLEQFKDLRPTKDPDVLWDSRTRLVDHRTLNSVIYKNVKYVAK